MLDPQEAVAEEVIALDVRDRTLTGLGCLKLLLGYHQIAADIDQMRHVLGHDDLEPTDLVRLASILSARARVVAVTVARLECQPLPAILRFADGGWGILGAVKDGKFLIHAPDDARGGTVDRSTFDRLWLGNEPGPRARGTAVLVTTREGLPTGERRFGIGWFIPVVIKYRRLLGEVLLASLVLQILALATPIFFQLIIDKVLVHGTMSTLHVLLFGFIAVAVFETMMGALRTYMFAHTTNRIDVELGARLFRHLVGLPMAYFNARRVGDSVARVRELETIREFLTSSALTVVIDLVFTVLFLAVMLLYSVQLTLIVLVSIPIYVAILMGVNPALRAKLDEKFKRGAENQAFLVEAVTGVETLKSMAVEPVVQARWERQLAGYVKTSFGAAMLANWGSQGVQLTSKLVTALILFLGAKTVIAGEMTVGELVAFNMFAGRVAMPVLRLAQLVQDFQQVRIGIDRLGDILNTPPEPQFTPGRSALPTIRGAVTFEHVTFRYRPDAQPVINDLSLDIAPGQLLGIVGASGSGKSTLSKLLQRLFLPEGGRVLVDGVDLAQVDPAWLRRQIGVVLQENILFNRSVRENIALADPAMPMARVEAVARLAGAHEFILELPEAYDTMVGERGATLSGGQRQRIAIARALLSEPRILIFDEATSALDAESEEIIQNNLAQIVRGRTTIIIAHRLSAVRACDKIIAVERGRIVEQGTHETLLALGGRYASLHARQSGTPPPDRVRSTEVTT